MNTIILFCERKQDWTPINWIQKKSGSKTEYGNYVIENDVAWLSVSKTVDEFKDYDEFEKETVLSLISNPEAYLIEWRGKDLIKQFVDEFPSGTDAVVDNDHGLICSIGEVKGLPIESWVSSQRLD